ncbi:MULTISPECIES: hypothetical protein [Chelativorans]|uniref:Uncharacterized protein n=1 Tax=Chelativorans sp. (strain BNC1) TaxID=266779 RepID=Q11CN8_CHESB|nr:MULTISPECIES: hypothetical protein [Chelativorans]
MTRKAADPLTEARYLLDSQCCCWKRGSVWCGWAVLNAILLARSPLRRGTTTFSVPSGVIWDRSLDPWVAETIKLAH